jgi:DnaJ like chaperone protein
VVLGLAPGADRETVRRAYLALVKRHHPDRHYAEGTPAEFIRVADLRMAEINAAYRTIMSS